MFLEKDDVLLVELNGEEVSFNDTGHFATDSKKIVKDIGDYFGTTVLTPEPVVASLNGWGMVYLCALIDPDFKVIEKADYISDDDIELVREIVKNNPVK